MLRPLATRVGYALLRDTHANSAFGSAELANLLFDLDAVTSSFGEEANNLGRTK